MPTVADLTAIVEKLAAEIPDLNLTEDEQEEYGTMLLRLQNTVETGEPKGVDCPSASHPSDA